MATVDVSELEMLVHDTALDVLEGAAHRFADQKRDDAAWSTRTADAIEIEGILDAGTTLIATVSVNEDPELPLGEWFDAGTEEHDIYPVNKQALYWEGADHPVKKVHAPALTMHRGWWSDGQQELAEQCLADELG